MTSSFVVKVCSFIEFDKFREKVYMTFEGLRLYVVTSLYFWINY